MPGLKLCVTTHCTLAGFRQTLASVSSGSAPPSYTKETEVQRTLPPVIQKCSLKSRPVLDSLQYSFIPRPLRFSIAIPNLDRACVWQPPDPKDWYSVGSGKERVNWVTAQDRHDLLHKDWHLPWPFISMGSR